MQAKLTLETPSLPDGSGSIFSFTVALPLAAETEAIAETDEPDGRDPPVLNCRPQLELRFPLGDRGAARAKHERRLRPRAEEQHSTLGRALHSRDLPSLSTLRMVDAAVTPVSVLPAPQGSTMMPERARPLPNI